MEDIQETKTDQRFGADGGKDKSLQTEQLEKESAPLSFDEILQGLHSVHEKSDQFMQHAAVRKASLAKELEDPASELQDDSHQESPTAQITADSNLDRVVDTTQKDDETQRNDTPVVVDERSQQGLEAIDESNVPQEHPNEVKSNSEWITTDSNVPQDHPNEVSIEDTPVGVGAQTAHPQDTIEPVGVEAPTETVGDSFEADDPQDTAEPVENENDSVISADELEDVVAAKDGECVQASNNPVKQQREQLEDEAKDDRTAARSFLPQSPESDVILPPLETEIPENERMQGVLEVIQYDQHPPIDPYEMQGSLDEIEEVDEYISEAPSQEEAPPDTTPLQTPSPENTTDNTSLPETTSAGITSTVGKQPTPRLQSPESLKRSKSITRSFRKRVAKVTGVHSAFKTSKSA